MVKEQGASDLHLKPMRPPLLRRRGKLEPIEGEPLKPDEIETMVKSILTPTQVEKLESNLAVDLGYGVKGVARFRSNVFYQRGTLSASFRQIPYEIQSVEELDFPDVLYEGTSYQIGQANNVFVFPGVGLGTLASGAREVLPEFFTAAAKAVSSCVSKNAMARGTLLPPVTELAHVSVKVAQAVGEVVAHEP